MSSPPVIHSQNQLIESLRLRIKELQDNLHTVYRQVETNQQEYETQIEILRCKYDEMNLEFNKKERLQTLEEQNLQG